jgi:tripartite motif-containing protein 71
VELAEQDKAGSGFGRRPLPGAGGTFIGIFGTGKEGSGDGEFNEPQGITALASSGEVAVADKYNSRMQIFDSEGNCKRQFGTEGKEADGQLHCPSGLVSDAHGNLLVVDDTSRLQVFSPEAAWAQPRPRTEAP